MKEINLLKTHYVIGNKIAASAIKRNVKQIRNVSFTILYVIGLGFIVL